MGSTHYRVFPILHPVVRVLLVGVSKKVSGKIFHKPPLITTKKSGRQIFFYLFSLIFAEIYDNFRTSSDDKMINLENTPQSNPVITDPLG